MKMLLRLGIVLVCLVGVAVLIKGCVRSARTEATYRTPDGKEITYSSDKEQVGLEVTYNLDKDGNVIGVTIKVDKAGTQEAIIAAQQAQLGRLMESLLPLIKAAGAGAGGGGGGAIPLEPQ